MKKGNYPLPPEGPPCRTFGIFGETKKSIQALRDYNKERELRKAYAKGWEDCKREYKIEEIYYEEV